MAPDEPSRSGTDIGAIVGGVLVVIGSVYALIAFLYWLFTN